MNSQLAYMFFFSIPLLNLFYLSIFHLKCVYLLLKCIEASFISYEIAIGIYVFHEVKYISVYSINI